MGSEVFVLEEDMVWNAPCGHGGIFEEFKPIARVGLKAKLPRPGAKDFFGARRLENVALDLAPVAGIVAVHKAEFPEAEALTRSRKLN